MPLSVSDELKTGRVELEEMGRSYVEASFDSSASVIMVDQPFGVTLPCLDVWVGGGVFDLLFCALIFMVRVWFGRLRKSLTDRRMDGSFGIRFRMMDGSIVYNVEVSACSL